MLDSIVWVVTNIGMSFYNVGYAIVHSGLWLGWVSGLDTTEAKQSLMRFIYYGGSTEFFFVVFTAFLLLTIVGILRHRVMWTTVRGLEWFVNAVGRLAAWAGLLMVLQQILIVFLQRIFRVPDITFGPFAPFGYRLWDGWSLISRDLSWWSEELKLYNAMIVTLCVSYTFVQGGHVRVDLIYSAVSHRTKRVIDMLGALFFMMPVTVVLWLYAWFFMWRHLITPKVSASDRLELLMNKARIARWNVETIGFSPNGFDAYFMFKILLVSFTALVFLQAVAFFYRSYLEFVEGEQSVGRYLDKDRLGDEEAETAAEIH